jgi:hypothetical protein
LSYYWVSGAGDDGRYGVLVLAHCLLCAALRQEGDLALAGGVSVMSTPSVLVAMGRTTAWPMALQTFSARRMVRVVGRLRDIGSQAAVGCDRDGDECADPGFCGEQDGHSRG